MKNELATAVIAALVGFGIAFVIVNLFFGPIEDVTVKTIKGEVDTSIAEPDPEVFNPKALNPTVEVYVGDDCINMSEAGECLDDRGGN